MDIRGARAPVGSSNTPSVATAATALAANGQRGSWSIQNQGTNVLFVRLGASASTTVYHYTLKAAAGAADGSGGILVQDGPVVYTGIVTVDGTSPSYTVWEGTA